MSLPVSHYEALLAEVRGLRRKAQRVQQLATPLISNCSSGTTTSLPPTYQQQNGEIGFKNSSFKMESLLAGRHQNASSSNTCDGATTSSVEGDTTCSEDECGGTHSTHLSVSSEPISQRDRGASVLYHGTWPVEKIMWNSEPTPSKSSAPVHSHPHYHQHNHHMEVGSVMSFASSSGGVPLDRVLGSPDSSRRSSQQFEAKVDMVYSLLAMLSGQEHADMGETLLALSTNPESCLAMRQSGCIPLLVQMVQSDKDPETRHKASQALHNLVYSQPDEKLRKREIRIFKLLEHTRAYTDAVRNNKEFEFEVSSSLGSEDGDKHPVQTVAHLMKLSFDELHRQAICQLGGIHTISSLVEVEHVKHGSTADEAHCILMRRYACMALTNLTFGDSGNKALLCSFRDFMRALVIQLQSPSDELRQVTASVLRNLSWRADSSSKEILREVGSVTGLMKAAMLDNKENTLKSILSALWNLSAHCTENKSEICSVEGALGFLVDMLTYTTQSKSLAIIENSGGILRNISSQIAVRDDYREILRQHNCLQILLDQLKSPSLTIVSNACGTLWNLSAKCSIDQEALWEMGAPAMLRSLNHSKHKMIAMGSSAALKNLLSAHPSHTVLPVMDSTALAMDLPALPTLGARKQKALLQDLDQTLSETYENIEKDSPIKLKSDHEDFSHRTKYQTSEVTSDYSSLTIGEPSTSYDTQSSSASLPYLNKATGIPVRNEIGVKSFTKKSFVKGKPKNVTKNESPRCEQDNKSFNTYTESDFEQSLEFNEDIRRYSVNTSSSNSLDNDKVKKDDLKLKEVSVYSDEKDHCSIEDTSDTDNQSSKSYDQKLFSEDLSYSFNSIPVLREQPHTSSFSLTPQGFTLPSSSNVTMFEGNIDEIGVDDISIHFSDEPKNEIEEPTEKQDIEKEKKSSFNEVEEHYSDFIGIPENRLPESVISATTSTSSKAMTSRNPIRTQIPLRKSLPRPIPNSSNHYKTDESINSVDGVDNNSTDVAINNSDIAVKKLNRTSRLTINLPRRTSTPVRIGVNANGTTSNSNFTRIDASSETHQVENIETNRKADTSLPTHPTLNEEDIQQIEQPPDVESSFLLFSPFSAPSVSGIGQGNLNISQETNTSQPEISPESEMGDRQSKQTTPEQRLPSPEKSEMVEPATCSYLNPETCVNFTIKDDRDRLLERSCEETNQLDNRMLDPDAMIESLDRFTAELVSQASHLQSDDKYKDNTWNEDTSPNEVTFPSISSNAPNVITFDSSNESENAGPAKEPEMDAKEVEQQSNDFSSINTSTMTESTLIAMEATKMATVFKNEAEMSHSITSVASLELDKIQAPQFVDSLSNSAASLDITRSPKLIARKKSLPRSLMVKRALSNSINNGSSLESLENNSLSNLDLVNPPSIFGEVFDMEGSITSVASLPSENNIEIKADFVINGAINVNNPLSNTGKMSVFSNNINSVSDLENVNPPSIFNEITDLCNSLADVATEAIGTETENFEDCNTHVLPTEDDVTEFSDANSATPIQSDIGSSPEMTPKKSKILGKQTTSKQRRNLARDRYKTYTIAAEMVMREEEDKQTSTSEDFKTLECFSEEYKSVLDTSTCSAASPKITPKERRRNDRSRYETRVVTESEIHAPAEEESTSSDPQSPARTKLSIRRNFMQKRLENRDRFKTQTLNESSLPGTPEISASPALSASPPIGEQDIHLLVHKEANLVLKSLRETKTKPDELLDCETLSLVSNEDDSEQNSATSINYKTYHKSWSVMKNVPVIEPLKSKPKLESDVKPEPDIKLEPNIQVELKDGVEEVEVGEEVEIDVEVNQEPVKPKIVKPVSKTQKEEEEEEEQQPQSKAIRGRRKPLYSKSTIGSKIAPKTINPIRTMTSNLVKNVTSSIKSVKQTNKNIVTKPPVSQTRVSSGYGTKSISPKTSPARTNLKQATKPPGSPLERQGTFTKDEPVPKSRIPTNTKIPQVSKIPAKTNNNSIKPRPVSSAERIPTRSPKNTTYNRSTSADSREPITNRRIQNSISSQSLKNERGSPASSSVRKSSVPQTPQRSGSNSSLNATNSARKQVTSKIASLWKKIEESKSKQPTKKDTRVWLQGQSEQSQLIRSNTFDNKNGVTLRNKSHDNDTSKRVSRLGSFIVMDDAEEGTTAAI